MMSQPSALAWTMDKKNPNLCYYYKPSNQQPCAVLQTDLNQFCFLQWVEPIFFTTLEEIFDWSSNWLSNWCQSNKSNRSFPTVSSTSKQTKIMVAKRHQSLYSLHLISLANNLDNCCKTIANFRMISIANVFENAVWQIN